MSKNKRNRPAFRPNLSGASLEERVVLSVPPGFNFVSPQQAAQFRAAFGRAMRSTQFSVRTQIQNQARQLFANGTPTAQSDTGAPFKTIASRPMCRYPLSPCYDGHGDPSQAVAFTCAKP